MISSLINDYPLQVIWGAGMGSLIMLIIDINKLIIIKRFINNKNKLLEQLAKNGSNENQQAANQPDKS